MPERVGRPDGVGVEAGAASRRVPRAVGRIPGGPSRSRRDGPGPRTPRRAPSARDTAARRRRSSTWPCSPPWPSGVAVIFKSAAVAGLMSTALSHVEPRDRLRQLLQPAVVGKPPVEHRGIVTERDLEAGRARATAARARTVPFADTVTLGKCRAGNDTVVEPAAPGQVEVGGAVDCAAPVVAHDVVRRIDRTGRSSRPGAREPTGRRRAAR